MCVGDTKKQRVRDIQGLSERSKDIFFTPLYKKGLKKTQNKPMETTMPVR